MVLLGVLYSAPPFRLKDHPVAGLAANGLGCGFLVVLAVMPDMTLHNTGLLGWDTPLYFFLTVSGVYAVTTIPDAPGDARTGKRTLAVTIGRNGALATGLTAQLLAAATAYASGHVVLLGLAVFATVLVMGALLVPAEPFILAAAKVPILLLNLAAVAWFPVYGAVLVVMLAGTRLYYQYRFRIVYPRLV